MKLPDRVTIVEVGPRDGLQNEQQVVPTGQKLEFIRRLVDAGLRQIEATSFVHPKAVPQLVDAEEVAAGLPQDAGVRFSALAPNVRGLERLLKTGIRRVAVFTAASETFTRKNINMSIDESLEEFRTVATRALAEALTVRGYVSTAFECPYEGRISPGKVLDVTQRLLEIGVDQVAISDTIGVAAPTEIYEVVELLSRHVPLDKLALHFHDTCGTALANVLAGLEMGVTTFDASAGGLGGCPYAPRAAGNLATEDLVYMLERMNIRTGVELSKLVEAVAAITPILGHDPSSARFKRGRL